MSYDIVIKNGTLVDGSGAPSYRSDLGIKDGKIAGFGRIDDGAAEVIEADGLVVSPGFIDAHTHMDAQIFWDPMGTNSCWHGVTSVVMGNCGFTLAPCRPEDKESFMHALEAVEDISAEAMMSGIDWTWGSYRDYLERISRLPKGINYGGYIGHTALRRYVMGERAFTDRATEDDLDAMRAELSDAIRAGALGFSTSRGSDHVTPDRRPVPSRVAGWEEVQALVGVMSDLNAGIFQIAKERPVGPEETRDFMDRLRAIAVDMRVPVTFGGIREREWMDFLRETAAAGGRAVGQVTTRPINTLWSFKTHLPYDRVPVWKEFRARPLEEQKRALRDPELRRRLVEAAYDPPEVRAVGAEPRVPDREVYERVKILRSFEGENQSIAEVARREGKDPVEVVIDLALATDFDQFFMQPLSGVDDGTAIEQLRHPRTVPTFSDSGAHVSQIVDCSLQTHLLAYWVRERHALSLEEAVRRITFDIAGAWGLHDRGLLREGMAADVIVFDPERLRAEMPALANDLPGGGNRLTQRATGYHASIVNGQVLIRDGNPTGALPGSILRGPLARERVAVA